MDAFGRGHPVLDHGWRSDRAEAYSSSKTLLIQILESDLITPPSRPQT
jgi:hypothetical protein